MYFHLVIPKNLPIFPLNSAINAVNANPKPTTTYGFTILLKNSIFNPSKTTNPKKKKNVAIPNKTLDLVSFAKTNSRLQYPELILCQKL